MAYDDEEDERIGERFVGFMMQSRLGAYTLLALAVAVLIASYFL